MDGARLSLLISRAFQLIFAVVVLGVSISLYQNVHAWERLCSFFSPCNYGRLPSSSIFAAFTEAFGILDALIGLAGAFVTAVPWFVLLAINALAAIFYFASGVNLAVLRGTAECNTDFCTRWTTSIAFCFLGFVASVTVMVLVFIVRRRSGSRPSHA